MLKRFWLTHLPALIGPLLIWGYLYYTSLHGKVDLWQSPFWEVNVIGIIAGMSFGYLICLVKWSRFLQKMMREAPPDSRAPE